MQTLKIEYAPTKTWKLEPEKQHVIKTCSYGARNVANFKRETNWQRFIGQNWQVEMWNYAQNSSSFKDGSQVQGHIWSEIFQSSSKRQFG